MGLSWSRAGTFALGRLPLCGPLRLRGLLHRTLCDGLLLGLLLSLDGFPDTEALP